MKWRKGLTIEIDPDSELDWNLNFRELGWLQTGENIASFTLVAGTGITVDEANSTNDNDSITAWISVDEGATGTIALTYKAVSDNTPPRKDDKTVYFEIAEQ